MERTEFSDDLFSKYFGETDLLNKKKILKSI